MTLPPRSFLALLLVIGIGVLDTATDALRVSAGERLGELGSQASPPPELFPTRVGTVWTYQGQTEWTTAGTGTVHRRLIRWHTGVVQHVRGPDYEAALVRGFPSDLAWYEPLLKPTLSAIVVTHDGRLLFLWPDDPRVAVLAAPSRDTPPLRLLSQTRYFSGHCMSASSSVIRSCFVATTGCTSGVSTRS